MSRFFEDACKVERLLIGSILIDASKCDEAMRMVNASDFADESMGWLFSVLAKLFEIGLPVSDTGWLVSHIGQHPEFTKVGYAALGTLVADAVHPGNAVFYATEVRKFAQRRRLMAIADQLTDEADDPLSDPETAATKASTAIMDVVAGSDPKALCTDKEAMQATMDRVAEIQNGSGGEGLSSGINCIDDHCGVMQAGELIVLAARPSVGKSAFALDFMLHNTKIGKRVLYVTCEMNRILVGSRLISHATGVGTDQIDNARITDYDVRKIEAAIAKASGNMLIWEASAPKVRQIASMARSIAAKNMLDLVVVDHVGLLKSSRPMSAYESATEIAKDLKSMATMLNKPVLALCQLTRAAEEEKPKLSQLRDSGAWEENADKVWLIHRDREESDTWFYVAKFRQGQVTELPEGALVFNRERCSFGDSRAYVPPQGAAWRA